MNNQENRPFLIIKEVSELLGISVSTINRLIKNGDFLQKIKISPKRIIFMKREIDEWIKSKKITTKFPKNKGTCVCPFRVLNFFSQMSGALKFL